MPPPSSACGGTSSRTTRSTTSGSSLSGLSSLFPLSSARPWRAVWTARSRSEYPRARSSALAASIASIASTPATLTKEIAFGRNGDVGGLAVTAQIEAADDRDRHPVELPGHELRRACDLVRDRDDRGVELVSDGVAPALKVAKHLHARCADGDVGRALTPRTPE